MAEVFAIAREPIDVAKWSSKVDDFAAGAFVSFSGRVRNHADGRPVESLAYEVYEELAVKEGERILREAREQFPIEKAAYVHRVGNLAIGDCAVWVGVSAAHRAAAFDACCYIVDQLKLRLPIWKKEQYTNGDSQWIGIGSAEAVTANERGIASEDTGRPTRQSRA